MILLSSLKCNPTGACNGTFDGDHAQADEDNMHTVYDPESPITIFHCTLTIFFIAGIRMQVTKNTPPIQITTAAICSARAITNSSYLVIMSVIMSVSVVYDISTILSLVLCEVMRWFYPLFLTECLGEMAEAVVADLETRLCYVVSTRI